MATTNPVFQVLVTKGNAALLAAGNKIDALAPGQLGMFNYHTGLSVDGTNLADVRDIFLAVGLDRDGDTVMDDVLKSAGQMIQRENIRGYNVKCYAPAQPKIIDITGFKANCETDYAIKVELRNQLGYLLNGYNQVAKTFVIKTGCCTQEECTSCPQGDCNELAIRMVEAINSDPEGYLIGETIGFDGEDWVVVTDTEAWIADEDNAGKCLGIRITTSPLALKKFCSINPLYFTPRGTDMVVSLVEGFECNGSQETIQDLKYEEGSGYDIAQLEYEAGGWNGKPGVYRLSTLAGMPLTSFESYVDQSAKYTVMNLHYDQFSVGGWLEYLNNLLTIIAVPCADTTTRASLATFMDRVTAGKFDQMASDIALCDCNGTNTPTSAINNVANDGIG